MQPTKRRGRPPGTTKPGDEKLLREMADHLLKEPALTPTAAVKRIVHEWTDTIIHRLTAKWRKEGETLLEEARQRQEALASRPTGLSGPRAPVSFGGIPAGTSVWQFLNSPTFRLMQEMEKISPILKLQREMNDTPHLRLIREMQQDPVLKLVQEQERLLGCKIGAFMPGSAVAT